MASLTGGVLLMVAHRIYRGELSSAIFLPWRIWVAPMFCFVLYGLVWPWAVASSNPRQVFGVNLINYLWPVLTVLFSARLVPGVRLTWRLLLALALALAGLVFANLRAMRELISANMLANGSHVVDLLPYVLALTAAVSWALYSALLARWRSWAHQYVTSPLGFVLIGLLAFIIGPAVPGAKPTTSGTLLTLLYGAGPLAVGYLFWELGLARARVQTLSLMAAATPVLSTLLLCTFLKTVPGADLALAALLVSAGVVLSLQGESASRRSSAAE